MFFHLSNIILALIPTLLVLFLIPRYYRFTLWLGGVVCAQLDKLIRCAPNPPSTSESLFLSHVFLIGVVVVLCALDQLGSWLRDQLGTYPLPFFH